MQPATALIRQARRLAGRVAREVRAVPHAWRFRIDRRRGETTKTQIVICGFPRGGTSLLYNMMASCLPGHHHDPQENRCLRYVLEWRDTISKNPSDVFRIEQLVRQNRFGKRLVVIVVLRDIRDVLTSRHPRVPDDYYIGWDERYAVDTPVGPTKLGRPGVEAFASAIEALQQLAGIDLIEVRYEDLVTDTNAVQTRIGQEADLSFAGDFADYHRAAKVAYSYTGPFEAVAPELAREGLPVDPGRTGRWRSPEHRDRIRAQFSERPGLFDVLRHHGYEDDDDWFAPYEDASG